MLKRPITYTNFDDETVTGTFYFNFSESELVSLELGEDIGAHLTAIIKAQDRSALLAAFKRLILDSYGVRSADGNTFAKTEEAKLAFAQTAAYDALFMELISSETAAAEFIMAVFPKGVIKQAGVEGQSAEQIIKQAIDNPGAVQTLPRVPTSLETTHPSFPPAPPVFSQPPTS